MKLIIITRPNEESRRAILEVRRDIKEIKQLLGSQEPEGKLLIHLRGESLSVTGGHVMVDFRTIGQFVTFELEILDPRGRRAEVDGDIVVRNSNEIAGLVILDQATRTGRLICTDEGIGHIDFVVDARIGPDIKELVGVIDFTGPNLTEASVFNVKLSEIQDPAPQA